VDLSADSGSLLTRRTGSNIANITITIPRASLALFDQLAALSNRYSQWVGLAGTIEHLCGPITTDHDHLTAMLTFDSQKLASGSWIGVVLAFIHFV